FFFSSRRRHTRFSRDWSSDVCSSDLELMNEKGGGAERLNQLFIADGKNRNPVDRLRSGDIGCTLKLKNTLTNHTLNDKAFNAQRSEERRVGKECRARWSSKQSTNNRE